MDLRGESMIPPTSTLLTRVRPPGRSIPHRAAFTLIELLVVVGVIVLMMTLAVPAFNTIRGGSDFSSEVYDIGGIIDQARAYAMSNNTYVLVGIMELNGMQSTNANPQITGTGRIAMAVIASKDGTRPYQYLLHNSHLGASPSLMAPGSSTVTGSGAAYYAVTKLFNFSNIHIVDLQPSQSGAFTLPTTGNMARPGVPPYFDVANSQCVSSTPFGWPLGTQVNGTPASQYPFGAQGASTGANTVIEFDPEGSARIITSGGPGGSGSSNPVLDALPQEIEIGLEPARGSYAVVPVSGETGQIAAIQIDGMSGSVHTYRPGQ